MVQLNLLNRKVALEDYLTRSFWKYIHSNRLDKANKGAGGWHGAKGADFNIDKPGQEVIERTSIEVVRAEFVEARFTLSLPAQGL
jgi:hypothetical protein